MFLQAPLSFFVRTDTGDLINRFSQDMTLLDQKLPSALYAALHGLLSCLADAGLIFAGAKYLAAVIPVAVLVMYTLQVFYLRTSCQMRYLDLQAKAPLFALILGMVDGLATIRAFGWQSAFRATSFQRLDELQKPYYLMFCIQRWLALVLDLFVAASAVILVAFDILTPSSTSANAIAISLYAIVNFNESLARLITSWTELEASLGAISRLRDFEKQTPSEIPKFAICGRTRSGKSSLVLALFRLLEPDSGNICIDGVDIANIPHDVLRGRLITIPQEPLLFPGTLRSNLVLARDGSIPETEPTMHQDGHLVETLTKVSLWPVVSLHGGLDTDISNFSLSHGQKQLLCLARAVVNKTASKILILDEATSAVDQETESLIVKILETEFASHTVVSVVYRLHTVRDSDIVIVLDTGSVVEMGPPGQLLAVEGGRFRSMWNSGSI
ncbi:ABC transporter atnG [Diaporthe amygdali]|uniref:ABC transporter atnG n=1 Tax=Phomopsis amygdali TaxID=1214568 RepID=UPI0022FDE3B8|nr:ABC transporter atnG [Diaporthe amygdali]KAJ0103906.1 ABC transporter atnG [Diaporthe amygdali]